MRACTRTAMRGSSTLIVITNIVITNIVITNIVITIIDNNSELRACTRTAMRGSSTLRSTPLPCALGVVVRKTMVAILI